MRIDGNKAPASSAGRLERLMIFLFFVAGAAAEQLTSRYGPLLANLPAELPYLLAFGTVLILSASVLGIALLPVSAFVFGGITGDCCQRIVEAVLSGQEADARLLITCFISVPVFFVLSVRGMEVSQMLGSLLDRSDYPVRTAYSRSYLTMALTAFAGVLAVCLILGYR